MSDTEPPNRFMVGAERNPDGTLNTSHALVLDDSGGELAAAVSEADDRYRQAFQNELKIPKDVRPGTARMVWYTLRNAIIVNEKSLASAQASHDSQSVDVVANRLTALRLEQQVLNELNTHLKSKDVDQYQSGLFPAADAAKILEQTLVETWTQKQQVNSKSVVKLGGKSEYVKDALSAASRLKTKLLDESPRK